MAVNRNLNNDQFRWVTTKDREGRRAYATPGGSVVSKDGAGSMPVTVYYPGYKNAWDADYGMVDTIAEGKAWAEDAETSKRLRNEKR